MNIEFNKEEKIAYLNKIGYQTSEYVGERDRDFYSGDKEVINVKADIAYIGEYPKILDSMDMYHLQNDYGLDSIFQKELSKNFKDFVMRELTK